MVASTLRPATEEDGLQVADMIAGMALDEATGRSHRYLARLEEKLEIIHVRDKKPPRLVGDVFAQALST